MAARVTPGLLRLGAGVVSFALLTWAAARVSVPLPGSPLPGTLQTLAVLLAGGMLGSRAGAASQVLYLGMGLAGLPVFALPGSGPAYLLGPTGGYLAGFAAAAWVTGRVLEASGRRGFAVALAACLLGSAVLHGCGVAWLTLSLPGSPAAPLLALLPFDLAKIVLAAGLIAARGAQRVK